MLPAPNFNSYWFWAGEIPPLMCEAIQRRGIEQGLRTAEVGIGEEQEVDTKTRISEVTFLDELPWLQDIMLGYARRANASANWNFALDTIDGIQFTRYEPGGFYDWHCDASDDEPWVRKLSVVLQLSNPETYKGGEFEFRGGLAPISQQGSILVFPSQLEHRVWEVTSGTRYSLVAWIGGPR